MSDEIKAAYDVGAVEYRSRYDSIPPRVEDVDRTFCFVDTSNPMVLEIGCAYGREAQYITTKTDSYLGIDISSEYINMARREVPHGTFVVRDAVAYDYPVGLDAVFAFASLLHSPVEDVQTVLERVSVALNPGGVMFISLKRRLQYETDIVDDGVTKRRFYYYTRQVMQHIIPSDLVEVFYDEQSREEEWFTMILQKTDQNT